jgi:hypothetical protein
MRWEGAGGQPRCRRRRAFDAPLALLAEMAHARPASHGGRACGARRHRARVVAAGHRHVSASGVGLPRIPLLASGVAAQALLRPHVCGQRRRGAPRRSWQQPRAA